MIVPATNLFKLNKIRQAMNSGRRPSDWVVVLANEIRMALESQLIALNIDVTDPLFMSKTKKVLHADNPDILEEYYYEDTLLVRVSRKYDGGSEQEFTIETPKYAEIKDGDRG